MVATPAFTAEQMIYRKPIFDQNRLRDYPMALLQQVLIATEKEYVIAEVVYRESKVNRKRQLNELYLGERIHVTEHAVTPGWENRVPPVYIPIRKGIQGYIVFLINKKMVR